MTPKMVQKTLLALATIMMLGASAVAVPPEPELDDPINYVRDILDGCYHQTSGAMVGFENQPNSILTWNDVHVVSHLHPHYAIGVLQYDDFDGDYWWYLILSGYVYWAHDCGEDTQLRDRVLMV